MAFSLVGWSESQDTSGNLTQVAALADQHVTTSGDDVVVPAFASKLAFVFASGTTISQAQISSPSLRDHLLLDVTPINIGAEPDTPEAIDVRLPAGIQLTAGEGLRALVAEGATGAEREYVIAGLYDKIDALPAGEIFTVRCTSSTTLTANAWTIGTLTFSQQLEAGRYAVVGMRAESAGLIAARLVLPGSAFRPGCIGHDVADDLQNPIFRYGQLGVWGEFEHTYPPQVEFLSLSADTSETVWLDLVKL